MAANPQRKINRFLVFRFRYKTAAFCLGCLLAAALPPFYYFGAAFLAFSGLVWLCCQVTGKTALAATGYWFGFGFFAAGFYWIGNALLVDAEQTGWLYPFVLFLNGAFFGIFTIVPIYITRYGKTVVAKLLLLAAGWGLCAEWLRGVFLTGFPWNPVSSILAFHPAMLQTLSWWGTYGLSVVAVALFSLPAVALVHPQKKQMWAVGVAALFPVLLWGYGEFVLPPKGEIPSGQQIKIRLVQPSIPQELKWNRTVMEENFRKYIDLSRQEGLNNADFVVWGETASAFDLTFDKAHRIAASSAVPATGYLISGSLRYEINGNDYTPYNSMLVIDSAGNVVDVYNKSHLVPFGEYIPLRKYLPAWVRPVANTIAEFGKGRQYQTITLDGYPEFAPLICYEVIFPGQVVRKENKPKWMVVVTNDGWYGLSSGPEQHLVAAQMRAVEEGISVVRSANSGISAIISPYGQITARIGLNKTGVADGVVYADQARQTLFGRFGNRLLLLLCGFFLLCAVLINRRQ